MDLATRVEALEEEVSILKGEIKSILLEVRTAVLAQDNPFAVSSLSQPLMLPNDQQQALRDQQALRIVPRSDEFLPDFHNPNGPSPAQAPEPHQSQAPAATTSQHSQPAAAAETPTAGTERPGVPQPLHQTEPWQAAAPRRRWDVNTLAMLLAWAQSSMTRLSAVEMASVLSLARYGGLIEQELEGVLMRIGRSFDDSKPHRSASVSEYLLALHELNTLIEDEQTGPRRMRPAS